MSSLQELLRPPRQYEPAWKELKEKGKVTLKVAPHLVVRVKKAVIKEKDSDAVWRLQLDAKGAIRKRITSKYDKKTWYLILFLVDCQTLRVDEL